MTLHRANDPAPNDQAPDHSAPSMPSTGGEVLYRGTALTLRRTHHALELELHREPINEIGMQSLTELEQALIVIKSAISQHQAHLPLLIYSAIRKGFCAGADLRELHRELATRDLKGTGSQAVRVEARDFIDRIHGVFDGLDQLPSTTIGAIHGFCFGGGFELALTCDILVADRSARFCFPELRLGIIPGFGGIPRLRRDVGNAGVRDLILSGRSWSAKRASQAGLVSQLTAKGGHIEVARSLCEQLSHFSLSSGEAKRFLKPFPEEELKREKEIFVGQLVSPQVQDALARFVSSTEAMPYLPQR